MLQTGGRMAAADLICFVAPFPLAAGWDAALLLCAPSTLLNPLGFVLESDVILMDLCPRALC